MSVQVGHMERAASFSTPSKESNSSDMDLFFDEMDFGALRIDPINYEIPISSLTSDRKGPKFIVPSWASTPGPTHGVALHEVRDGKTVNTHDLDLPNIKYYLFGRSPECPCKFGFGMKLKSENVSRQHFAIVHSKYEALYLIDLGSVHGTFMKNKRVQSYHPIQLENGNVLSVGGWKSKYLVRIFPKRLSSNIPFSKISTATLATAVKEQDEASFDNQTKLHTHINQVPDLPSPKGRHLIKPQSFYSLSPNIPVASPLDRSPRSSSNSSPSSLFRSFSTYDIRASPTNTPTSPKAMEVKPVALNFNNFSKPGISFTSLNSNLKEVPASSEVSSPVFTPGNTANFYGSKKTGVAGGILKKKCSIVGNFRPKRLNSMRRVSFYEGSASPKSITAIKKESMKERYNPLGLVAEKQFQSSMNKSHLNIVTTDQPGVQGRDRRASISSVESDTIEEEAVQFDPLTDLPDIEKSTKVEDETPKSLKDGDGFGLEDFNLSLKLPSEIASPRERINGTSKNGILRTYSVQNVRKRFEEDVQFSFFGAKSNNNVDGMENTGISIEEELSIRRRGQGFENRSPLSRQVKRAKSFHMRE